MTMEQEWQRYKAQSYPHGIPSIQEKETRRSFMAGAAVVFATTLEIAALEETQAMKALAELSDDMRQELEKYGHKFKARN